MAVSAPVTGLTANTTYHFRISATNPGGTSTSTDEPFKTLTNAPSVEHKPPASLTQTSASLSGTVNPEGGAVSKCEVEYGTTSAYGSSVPCSTLPGSGSSPVTVSASLTGLSANTTYHFRISATNPGGTSKGADATFKTLSVPPPAVSSITPSSGAAAGGTAVRVTGTGFLKGATVTIGSAATAVEVVSETEIKARTAAASAGADEVVVAGENGTSTGGPAYTYEAAPTTTPTVTGANTASTATAKSGVLGSTAAAPPPPKLAVSGNVAPVSGSVLVKLPGSSIFVALTSIRQIPFGTVIDATAGSVTVTTVGPHGVIQTITYSEGEFKLTQGRSGVVVATLVGGDFTVCPTARQRSHRAIASAKHASGKHVVRKLWSEGHGKYSTKGNYAAGAVLGTRWLTEDLCGGTLIHVVTDRVAVTNFVNHRHVTVKAGHSYLAKAPADYR